MTATSDASSASATPAEQQLAGITPNTSGRPTILGTHGMAVSGHYLASLAGLRILESGGNAIDAGVSMGLATNVLESTFTGLGGVAPCLLYRAEHDEVVCISGVGWMPKAASCEYFQKHHGGIVQGVHAQVVPAAADAWLTALEEFGTLSFAEVAAAAIAYARDGFPMYPFMQKVLKVGREGNGRWPTNMAIYYQPDGSLVPVGAKFVQADLGRTLQYLADEEKTAARNGRKAGIQAARDAFYKGDIAATIAAYHNDQGGLMTREDMADFRVGIEPPCKVDYRAISVYSSGPYSQGPSFLQALKILERFDIAKMAPNSPDYVHVITEAIKLVAADRDAYIGDPRFVGVPMEGLLSETFAKQRARMIRPDTAWPDVPQPGKIAGAKWPTPCDQQAGLNAIGGGQPARRRLDASAYGTSYLCVMDKDGNMFSATPSDGTSNGMHGGVVSGLGFVPSTRGVSAWADPNHPSSVASGKRPRLTMGPALAVRPGKTFMPLGTPGTDVQLQAMLQILFDIEHFAMDPQTAVEQPRFATYSFPGSMTPHANYPGRLNLERGIGEETGKALAAKGHRIEWWPDGEWLAGSMCTIIKNCETGVMHGAADPRRTAYALGW